MMEREVDELEDPCHALLGQQWRCVIYIPTILGGAQIVLACVCCVCVCVCIHGVVSILLTCTTKYTS